MKIDENIEYHHKYSMEDFHKKIPIYDTYPPKKINLPSHDFTINQPPIETTNLNLHIVYDKNIVVKRGPNELFDRQYGLFGLVGNTGYSTVETFVHDEEDTELSEIP